MCFTPIVSLGTAIIEFVLATVLLLFFPKTKMRNFFAVFIYWLGAYQLSEFFLCTTNYSIFWAIVGIILYTFLPALSLHGILRIFKKRVNLFLIYIIPVAVTAITIGVSGFVRSAKCLPFFVLVETASFQPDSILSISYFFVYSIIYYFGFFVVAGWIIAKDYLKKRNKIRRKIDVLIFVAISFMILSMLILAVVFPAIGFKTPSILCEIAIVVAVLLFIATYLETKLSKRFSS